MSFFLIIREAVRGLLRTGAVGAVSVLTIAAALLVLGVFSHLARGGLTLARAFRERVEVDVYLKDGVSRAGALALVADLQALPGVASARYVDKERAAAEFDSLFGEGFLKGLSVNPLPASVRVRPIGKGDVTAVVRSVSAAASGRKEVESVAAGEEWLAAFDATLERVLLVGLVLGGALCLACFFAVGNTAKLMVLSQRDVIEVMRLVGATGRAIRMTFLLGGMLQGMAGGALAAAAFELSRSLWEDWLPQADAGSSLLTFASAIAVGAFFGFLGSWASLSRVLRAVAWRAS